MIFTIGTLVWCGIATYQATQDARHRLLPWGPTIVAVLIGLVVGWRVHALGTGPIWWWWHVAVAAGLVLVGLILWYLGALGLGDVASFGVFGLLFGLVGSVALIALSYGVMAIIAMSLLLRRHPIRDLPLGIPLWMGSIPAWIVVMGVMPRIGGIG